MGCEVFNFRSGLIIGQFYCSAFQYVVLKSVGQRAAATCCEVKRELAFSNANISFRK